MGRKLQKGKRGNAANYITRNQALKKLQLSLSDFRRLCILKGVYPRDPRKKVAGKSKTYYLTKDIQFLSHEQVLVKFREMRAFRKKIKKAIHKNEPMQLAKLKENRPRYTLDHVVKERFPTFVDAVRDMDDALCLVHLFAMYPASGHLKEKRVQECGRLAREFQEYVIRTGSLRKVFMSIKGIYYQAEIQRQTVTWIVPHAFSQRLPTDVDYKVMFTFLSFYQTMMKFINFKLFQDLGLSYPSTLDVTDDDGMLGIGTVLCALAGSAGAAPAAAGKRKSAQKAERLDAAVVADENEEEEEEEEEDETQQPAPDAGVPVDAAAGSKQLFAGCKFFLSREVPRESMLFVTSAFGGSIGWEGTGSPFEAEDGTVTHEIVDRPVATRSIASREYVQPQWVVDSVNAGVLLPIHEYRPGSKLPPHLSPFVDDDAAGYKPQRAAEIDNIKSRLAAGIAQGAAGAAAAQRSLADGADEDDEDDADKAGGSSSDEEEDGENGGGSDEDEDDEEEEVQVLQKGSAASEKELAIMMMPKKKRKLYEKMQYGIKRKQEANATLMAKRNAAEGGGGGGAAANPRAGKPKSLSNAGGTSPPPRRAKAKAAPKAKPAPAPKAKAKAKVAPKAKAKAAPKPATRKSKRT